MSNADPRGQFVWHELLTTDAAAATAFYTKVVSWKTQPWEHDASYSMWVAKNGPVGGVASMGESGSPHWLPYIGVTDIAATIETAKELGATVRTEPTSIPTGGQYALLADPQGAEFGIYVSGQKPNGAAPEAAGDFTWHELATTDAEAAMDFYTRLFGWEAGPTHDMGEAGLYHLFLRGGEQYGGIYTVPEGEPSWLCYVRVEDAGKAARAAKAAGGRVVSGPMEVPGGSWVAQVIDREGAAFAVHQRKSEESARKPAKSSRSKARKADGVMATEPEITESTEAASPEKPAAKPKSRKPAKVAAAEERPAAESAEGTANGEPADVTGEETAEASVSAPEAAEPARAAKPVAKRAAKKGRKKVARKVASKAAPARAKATRTKSGAARGKAAKKAAAKGKGRGKAARKSPGRKAGRRQSAAPARAAAKKKTKASRAKAKKRR